jgi:hypothetical protein
LLSLLRGCRTVQSPYRPPPGHVFLKKSALKASFLPAGLPVFPRRRRLCYKISSGENIALRLEPTYTGDGTISLPTRYVLAIVPFVIRRPWSSGLGWPGLSGVVAFPKLSKLLNQEDALSAPCLQHFRGKFCSPQAAPSRGAGMLRTGGTLQFDVTLPFWITESSCSQAPMSPRWWWQMHGQSAPVQGQAGPSWQGGADVWILLPQ